MNVAQLKKILADLPDEMEVFIEDENCEQDALSDAKVCDHVGCDEHGRPNASPWYATEAYAKLGDVGHFTKIDKPVLLLATTEI